MKSIFAELGNENLADVDTSYPLLKPGIYPFEVQEIDVETSEKGYQYIGASLSLTQEAESTEGAIISVGYNVRAMIGLTVTDKAIEKHGEEKAEEKVRQGVCRFLDAMYPNQERPWDETMLSYKGQTLFAKVKIEPEREDKDTGETYPAAVRISTFIEKEAV